MGQRAVLETVVLVVDGDGAVRLRRVSRRASSLDLVDSLARLQLAARRRGWSAELHDPSAELLDLLDLVGLTDVVIDGARPP